MSDCSFDSARLMAMLQGGGGGGAAGGSQGLVFAGGKMPIAFLGALEDYHNKIWQNLDFTQKQIMPGIGQYFAMPTMNPNSLLARLIAEIFKDIFHSVQDAGIGAFANMALSEEDKQKLLSVMEAIGRLEIQDNPVVAMQMVGSGWKSTLDDGIHIA